MEIDRLLAVVCQRPDEGRWSGTLPFLMPGHLLGELEELAEHIKTPQYFDHLLVSNLADAASVARFLLHLGQSTQSARIAAFGLLAQGDVDRQSGQPETAMRHHEEAAHLFHQGGDMLGWARAQSGWLGAAIHAGRLREEELGRFEQVRAIFAQAGQPYRLALLEQTLGVACHYLGNLQQARLVFERALEHCPGGIRAGNHLQATLLANLANVLLGLGETRRARDLHRQAHAVFTQLGSSVSAAHEEFNLCLVERQRGNYREALRAAQAARERFLQAHQPQDAASASIARAEILLQLNRAEEALYETQQAIAILRAHEQIRIDLVKALTVQAHAYARARQAPEALACLQQAETVAAATSYPELTALVVLERARLLLAQKQSANAREVALAGLKTNEVEAATYSSDLLYLTAAEAALAQGMTTWARAIAQMVAEKHQDEIPDTAYRAYVLLAQIAASSGDASGARQYYDRAITFLGSIVQTLVNDQRAEFLQDKDPIFLAALNVALEAGTPLEALLYLEQGRTYADWVAPHTGVSGKDQHLMDLLQRFRNISQEHRDGLTTAPLRQSAWQVRSRQEQQAPWQSLALPSTASLLHTRRISGTTLAYTLLEDDVVIFVLQGATPIIRRVPNGAARVRDQAQFLLALDIPRVPQQLEELNKLSLPQLAESQARLVANMQQRLHRLWELLIAPIAEFLPAPGETLRLVPHGRLHALPLAALYNGSRYLVEDWEVQILPSCLPRARSGSLDPAGRPPLVLAYADEHQLPWVVQEAKRVGSLLEAEVWSGEDARSERLLAEGIGRRYLHLAAHGAQRADLPQSSYVLLADGPCHPLDIQTLDLRGCQLVTLSACETGLGVPRGGDAQLGLVRAFRQAGAEAVLATLWRVDDASTYLFMESFYRYLVTSAAPVRALRAAQLSCLRDEERSLRCHPFFWAGYQLTTFVTEETPS